MSRLRWARVRYTVSAGSDSQGGTVALGAIQPDLFEMRIAYPRKAKPGQPYRLRVQTTNPVTRTHTPGVSVSARMSISDADKPQMVHATTDSSGAATLVLKMPAQPQDEPDIEVNATLGDQKQSESLNVQFDAEWQVLTSTDKELYQPGQAFHARALCLGPDKHALAKQDLRFTLVDPEDNVVLRDTAKTNDYGIAHVDWSLPESLRLGDYRLRVDPGTASDDDEDSGIGTSSVRISRYDLPNFSVSAQPDRGYYLPGQNATVKIAALYLFGKPVLHGKVRVVRESERHWDYKTQKWEAAEDDETLGALDGKGNYELKLDLGSQFDELESDNYKRYQDLNYAAYITDETTGKTEQKRFAVRLSRDRVHVYLSGETYAGGEASFYVATYFPDGSPAKCDVQLSEIGNGGSVSAATPRLFSTNKYGVAKISNMHLQNGQDHSFKFVLIDPSGTWTTHMEDVWFGYAGQDDFAVAVETDHALYKPGDPIYASIRAPHRVTALTLDVTQNDTVLRTMSVRVRNGHADVTIPYEPTFKGELTISAYDLSDRGEDRWRIPYGTHTVMFPEDRTLRVEAQVSKASY
ncbi:MAG TPA: MG2 domain-containing protein, partial [Terriglobales bacterium]